MKREGVNIGRGGRSIGSVVLTGLLFAVASGVLLFFGIPGMFAWVGLTLYFLYRVSKARPR
jgi:hypothetical protein